jgi:hypothetical protein
MGWALDEALEHMVELPDRAALIAQLNYELSWCQYTVRDDDVRVHPYGYDERLHWDTHIVLLRNKKLAHNVRFFGPGSKHNYFGVIGFTDGPC